MDTDGEGAEAGVNLGAARTRLLSRGFQYITDNAVLNDMLNNAKNALEDEYAWPWLETTATTQAAPVTITDLKSVEYVVDTTNDRPLGGIDPRTVPDLDGDPTTTGTPLWWWLDGTQMLQVYPLSSSVQISVRYVKFSPDLANDSDTPLIPARYHSVWVDYAVVEAYKDQPNFNAANALLGDIRQRRLPQMIQQFAGRNRQNPESQVMTGASIDS